MVSKKVSVSVSENFGIEKSIGIGFENFWYRKKNRYRFRKILVSEKVSVSVSGKIGIGKKLLIQFRFLLYKQHIGQWKEQIIEITSKFGFDTEKNNKTFFAFVEKVKVCSGKVKL